MKAFFILFSSCLLSAPAFCQTPTTWRGPSQSGIYNETGLLDQWPAAGPEIIWSYDELGTGYSSPAIVDNTIYVSGMEGSTGYVYSLTTTGELKWKSPYGGEWNRSYPGSRSTPVIAGDHLYMISGVGVVTCMRASDGKMVWSLNIFNDFGGRNIEWGINETPVIHGDMLICTPGGTRHNVIALNRFTGDLVWSTRGKGEKSAYCTPLLTNVGNRNLLITHTEHNILGIDADKGTLLWNYGHTNRYSIHPNTPLIDGEQVFCFSGYGQGGVMLNLYQDGQSASRRWVGKTMDSRMGGAVLVDGKIYGSGDENRAWQCMDWSTGKVDYKTTSIGNGVIIAADGKLYFYSQRGELAMVKPGQGKFDIVSKTRVTLGSGQHWAHPVIYNGLLLLRHGDALIAYKIK